MLPLADVVESGRACSGPPQILSAPLNQLYNFVAVASACSNLHKTHLLRAASCYEVTSNEFMDATFVDKLGLARVFLVETYLVLDLEGDIATWLHFLCVRLPSFTISPLPAWCI